MSKEEETEEEEEEQSLKVEITNQPKVIPDKHWTDVEEEEELETLSDEEYNKDLEEARNG